MNLLSRAVRFGALAILGTVLIIETGCGDVFRPIASPVPQPGGDPQPFDNFVLIHCNGTTGRNGPLTTCSGTADSTALLVSVSGDVVQNSTNVGVAPGYASFDVNRSYYYVPSPGTDTVHASSLGGTGVTATLPLGSNPIATFAGSSQMYVLNAGSGSVCANLGVMNPVTLALNQTACVGSSPSWAVETANNLYVLDKALNQVNVYSTQQNKFITTIAVGTTPVWATLSFDSNYVYVLNQGSNDISIIDANSFAVVGTVATGGTGPIKGYFDSKLVRLYVLNQGDTSVTAFNALTPATLTQVGKASVGTNPLNLTILTDGSRGFVANGGTNTITEFNTGSFSSKAITVGADATAQVTDITSSRDGSKVYAGYVTSGNLKNGVTILRTTDETVVTELHSPRQDVNCNPGLTTCPLQQPQEFAGGR